MDPQQFPIPPSRHFNKKIFLIVGGVILLLAVIVVIAISLMKQDPTTSPQQVQRPGYNNVPATMLDPAPLKEVPSSQAITAQDTTVIQACNLFTLNDLAQHQLYLHPNPLANFKHSYFNGQGTGAIAKERGAELDSFNSCNYPLQEDSGINLTVLQSGYNTMRISSLLTQQQEIQGFKIYTDADEDDGERVSSTLHITKDNVAVEVHLQLAKSDASPKKQQIIDTIIKNLSQQITTPTGPVQFEFDSPAFRATVTHGCSISKPEDFATIFGVQPAPFVTEQLSTAVGAIRYSTLGDKDRHAYVESNCERFTGEAFANERKKLTVEVKSYATERAAQLEMQASKGPDGGQETDQPIGDEAYIATATEGLVTQKPGSVLFRKGQTVVSLSFNNPDQPDTERSITGYKAQLQTVATAIANRL